MDVEIISSKDNKLLDRKEINAIVQFEGATPARKELREAVSTKIGLNPDLTILNSVVNEFGVKKIRLLAHSYKDMKKLMEVEPEYLRKRDGVGVPKEEKKEKPKEEAPKEEPKKEEKKPAEKPKEEPKKEEAPKKEEKPGKEEAKNEEKKEKPKEKKEAAEEEKKGE